MTVLEEDHAARGLERIQTAMWALAGGGALAAWAWHGWEWGAGFALGALASWLNFRWLKQLVEALGLGGTRPSLAVAAGLRYLLLGTAAYVILRYSPISLPAALTGLFVPVAAVIIEILIELVYGRN